MQVANKNVTHNFTIVDLPLTMALLQKLTKWSQDIRFEDKYIEADYNLDHLNLLDKEQQKLFKNIATEFDKTKDVNKQGDEMMAGVILDENFFSTLTSLVTA